jgi:2-methylcitrate dehydratase PrpD
MAESIQITEPLSRYIVSEQAGRLPPEIVQRAKTHILDTIGAMVSGSELKPGKVAIEFVRTQGGPGDATVVAADFRTSPVLAALANAMTAHADETDDAHFPTVTHPGSVILPSALAIAEVRHSSGRDLIAAVVLGYDVMCRINKAFDRAWMGKRGLHAGSLCAVFGAAAAASRLLGASVEQVRHSLALAASQASGVNTWRQDPEHIDKALCFSGASARNGVTAALMAQAGFTGTATVFEGEENFFKAFSEDSHPEEVIKELGSRYEILDTSIKKYPAGQPIQATLEGYFSLVKQHALDGRRIQKIIVRLPDTQARTINDRHMPDVNCQYMLAVAMLDGKIDFQNSHDFARMHDPQVLELKKRVELIADPELTKIFPAVRSAIVEITTADGGQFKTLVDRMPGAPYNPLSAQEVEEKFISLSVPVLGEDKSQTIARTVRGLDDLGDVAKLTAVLTR